ncbi:Por secretion system C-terminal sorting domain-containing protein [Tenacibaculum sp. MAR_2009_124]|uniref:YCF48-related protein n=1 Tax=Tenacibaculum sp. MAR_2009_124 TaxID=1250059 RepID=UPI000894DED1|nr:YCF48-related protein [Tenacibaculum sp. MAR_2009_124]SEB86624.1 Por secretion system C-terminal sorting domain-containing protein [Tenacibaculum sp. MAR_2009_124]
MKKNLLILLYTILCFNKMQSQTNWELLNPKPTANTGKDVEFVTNNIGYIITSNELLETIDAGSTWLKKQNISSGNDMSFYNATGYIVGNYGYVLKSIDNGISWSQISTGFNISFNTVNIIDDNNIILSTSNSIVKTDDGGTTWESLSIPNSAVNKTSFTNSLVGHAVCNNGIILKTIDGGENWYTTKDDSNTFPSDYFTVYFINENIGFATREHDDMYKTTDAGETWVEISGPGEAIYDFHFLDENNGFITGDHGATYKTIDGGNTWSQIFFQNGFVYNTSMYGIYFQDSNIGYATGARGRIIKTTDGGNTWVSHSENYNDFNDLKIFDTGTGFARSGSNYYKTTDFGDNWTSLSSVDHYSWAVDSHFIDENIGFSIGGGSVEDLFKTTDGGETWTEIDIYGLDPAYTVYFINENIGFISGGAGSNIYNRRVYKTVNGGNNWTQVLSQISFGQIQFVNDLVGYGNRIGYSNGRMYKTIDGGETWSVNIEVDEEINAFHFVDENNGYFVGDQGLIYKTNDGGSNWEELEIPYEWYTQVKFYSKNVGYVADEDGKLYKTENGGVSWEYLTQQYIINSIELIDDKIYTAGTNGKIYRSDIEYETIILHVNSAENVSNSIANLTGNVTSNGESISNIQFEYSLDYSFSNSISTTPNTINSDESLNVSVDLASLEPNTTYYFRLSGIQSSNTSYSEVLSFTTLPDYEIATNFTYNYTATTAEISGNIVSNQHDIINVEFEYGLSSDNLNNNIIGTPVTVNGNTTENITASLDNLQPETQYFYRIKATHQGEDIYGNIQSFTTRPEYNINLYSPNINGTDVTLSAYLTSYHQDITDIMFEYGSIDYENSSVTNPSIVNANSSSFVSTTITGLDTSLNYYYRLKAIHNGETIYSDEGVFNLSGNIIIVSGTIEETQNNSLEIKGLINPYGAFLTDVHFEYGLTDSFGSSVTGTPNYAFGYNTNLINGSINNPIANTTYYYRLAATNSGNVIYSDTYQFTTTGTLSLTEFGLENTISIFPNPTTDFLNIKSNVSEKIKSIELYNALGQSIYYEVTDNKIDIKIDLSSFRKGIYFVKIRFENTKIVSSKLILK